MLPLTLKTGIRNLEWVGFMNMSTGLDETILFVEAKYEHTFLWTFQIVGYLYVTLFIYFSFIYSCSYDLQ